MRIRTPTRWIAGLVAVAGLACRGDGQHDAEPREIPSAATARPNVIVILTDDQTSSSLPFMSHTQALLVREGTSFSNFFINDPICCPSRVTFLTGEYRQNHRLEVGAIGCSNRFFDEGRHRRSIGKLVHDAGYRTGYLGKYLNWHHAYVAKVGAAEGDDHLLVGWDDYHVVMERRFYGFTLHENGELRSVPDRPRSYQTDVLSHLALKFIEVSAAKGEPFFLFIAPDAPHEPATPAARHLGRFQNLGAPRGPSFNQADVSGQQALGEVPLRSGREIAAIDGRFRAQLESLQAVDEMVRDIVGKLEATGQLANTFLFFASDNGYHFGEHRILNGKGTPFEESVRVPFVVRGPGVAKNRELAQLATNADLLPTVLDIIGEGPGERVDGRSLAPLFGPGAADVRWRHAVPLESRHERRNEGVPAFGAIRTRGFKWIEYEDGGRALYDLANDPYEMTNVHGVGTEAIATTLSEWLRDLLACSGAACRSVEDDPRDERFTSR